MRVLVTGGSGFVGQYTLTALQQRGHEVRAALRSAHHLPVESVIIGDIHAQTAWDTALTGVEVVIHLAARVHVLKETATDPLTAFRQVNTDGTRHLAESAVRAGVKRFIFVSTIGVNGENTPPQQAFSETSPPQPHSPYAQSKWEAEQALQVIPNLEVVTVRPPLVYGPQAPGNFARLVKLVKLGLPLPLGLTNNCRSFVAVQNLADFLAVCVDHPQVAQELFLMSDGEDVSTGELIRRIGKALGKNTYLLPVPPIVMTAPLKLLKREGRANQLFGSLQVNSQKARVRFGWQPPLSLDAALATIRL